MNEAELDKFRSEVNWNLACGALADVDLPVVADDGSRPVVVALEDELLRTLLGRLRAVGGYANLFVRGPDRVRVLSVVDERCSIATADDDLTSPGDRPGASATVGMFLDYVSVQPNGVVITALSRDASRSPVARDAHTVDFTPVPA